MRQLSGLAGSWGAWPIHEISTIFQESAWLAQEKYLMAQSAKPLVVGFNHVALEVGDIE
jgi:hypothetical protein